MRRPLLIVLVLVAIVLGYGAADVYDLVPGILTRAGAAAPAGSPPGAPSGSGGSPAASPTPTASSASGGTPAAVAQPLAGLDPDAPRPSAAGLTAALAPFLADPALGGDVGLSVRDGSTGQELYARSAGTLRTPASTLKLLTTAAVWTVLKPDATMRTTVVQGADPGKIVLVAGGDTLLARGAGVPGAVAGRAGLRDLADQVAGRLRAAGTTRVTLSVNLGYAQGPRYPSSWRMADVAAGYTQGVAMIGLADQRPSPGKPSPTRPEVDVATAFVAALATQGITATIPATTPYAAHAGPGSQELGAVQSAPYADVVALALDESDNALMENIARQAAVASGRPATFPAATSFVLGALRRLGVDTTGLVLKDTSGLGVGSLVRARTLSQVLALAASNTDPPLRASVAALPIAGLTGTLADRFESPSTRVVAGIPRAKTGTLTGTSALAGTTVDADGRLLLFVAITGGVPSQGTDAARAALDRLVTGLTGCGCR